MRLVLSFSAMEVLFMIFMAAVFRSAHGDASQQSSVLSFDNSENLRTKSSPAPEVSSTSEINFIPVEVQQTIPAGSNSIEAEETNIIASTYVVSPTYRPDTSSNTTKKRCDLRGRACSFLPAACWNCAASYNCTYGSEIDYSCSLLPSSQCASSSDSYAFKGICAFCYQLPASKYGCSNETCDSRLPGGFYNSTCTVHEEVLCLGNRSFKKRRRCNWTSGYRRSTALLFSITLGGFGADRFYLDDWRGGLGKLFSFGGLGVWTIVDIVLIGVGYLTPHDGSLYYD